MKTFLSLGAIVAIVSAQTGIFEPADFNITEALISNGVNVSAISELSGLVERTARSGCSIAVCFESRAWLIIYNTDNFLVLFAKTDLRR
jgi:hypothetical protein